MMTLGTLWEHFVLNEIMARSQSREVFYWRDKRGHEVDFVIAAHRKRPVAIECRWSANNFDPTNLVAFRHQHPEGDNIVLAHDVDRAFTRNYGDLSVRFDGVRSFAPSFSAGSRDLEGIAILDRWIMSNQSNSRLLSHSLPVSPTDIESAQKK
jgi:hypothetical protein